MKRYTGMRRLTDNPFLNLVEMDALRRDGSPFKYYFATRRKEGSVRVLDHSTDPDGISLFAVHKQKKGVVLIREYRFPIDAYILDVPAGLVEPGEDPLSGAVREFKEETGMDFEPVKDADECMQKGTYSSVGLTDEMISTVYGYAFGEPDNTHLEASEDIRAFVADREECRRILREERITMRAAYLLMLYLSMPEDDPFRFLHCAD